MQEGIYDEFVAKAKTKAMERNVGDPWGENVQQGPLVRYNLLSKAKEADTIIGL